MLNELYSYEIKIKGTNIKAYKMLKKGMHVLLSLKSVTVVLVPVIFTTEKMNPSLVQAVTHGFL